MCSNRVRDPAQHQRGPVSPLTCSELYSPLRAVRSFNGEGNRDTQISEQKSCLIFSLGRTDTTAVRFSNGQVFNSPTAGRYQSRRVMYRSVRDAQIPEQCGPLMIKPIPEQYGSETVSCRKRPAQERYTCTDILVCLRENVLKQYMRTLPLSCPNLLLGAEY